MLFIESPAFVGFSFSDTAADNTVGDGRTTADCVEFLRRFVQLFPQYRGRALWVSGESYAGHFVPLLTEGLLNDTETRDAFAVQGFLVGNPYSDAPSDNMGQLDFLTQHYLLSERSASRIVSHCDLFNDVWPLEHGDAAALGGAELPRLGAISAQKCDDAFARAYADMGAISVYDVYEDVCIPERAVAEQRQLARMQQRTALRRHGHGLLSAALLGLHARTVADVDVSDGDSKRAPHWRPDPCIDSEVSTYLNRPDVQAAMHANTSGAVPGPWSFCNPSLDYSERDAVSSMNPVYERLLRRRGLRLVVYSGTIDASCPTAGTFRWLKKLDLPEVRAWAPWQMPSGQTGGHWVRYQGLDMVMVRGAGHMVPYIQPDRALHLFSRIVSGRDL